MKDDYLVDVIAVNAAARRLEGYAKRTPLLRSTDLDERVAARVLLKAESLQHTGSFKFRGAFNRLSQLNEIERARGVVAWSSGNHAQGIAAAARILGIDATIVMPADAPRVKLENTLRLGARVRTYDRAHESREDIAYALVSESGATLVPSYDDQDVIAGQGTVGLEIAEQTHNLLNSFPDIVLVPCGGGGLIAGCALALHQARADAVIYSVEPEHYADTAQSLLTGQRVHLRDPPPTLCDALMAPMPGSLTFPILSRLVKSGLAVTDDMVLDAMAYAARVLKLVIEPGGAVGLAALLNGLIDVTGATVAIVLSGGNVDANVLTRALSR